MDKVSIIVPAYNASETITRTLNSILNQTYKNIEIIVINDGSTDNTSEIVKKSKDNRIKLIEQKNGGVSKARNNGLKFATGKYVLFIDSDDILSRKMIELLLKLMSENESDLVICNYINISYKNFYDNIFDTKIINTKINNQDQTLRQLLVEEKINGQLWNKLYKKDLLNNIEFDENMCLMEDADFLIRYLLKSKKIITIDSVLYAYIINEGSITKNIDIKRLKNKYLFIEKINEHNKMKNIKKQYCEINNLKTLMAIEKNIIKFNIKENEITNKQKNLYKNYKKKYLKYLKLNNLYLIPKRKKFELFLYYKFRFLYKIYYILHLWRLEI